ncbi:MAG TPA: protein-glutamate O-methyltransferase CheR [Bacteroidetes bacterium]|nr:protein-glutamate O-methyltransferase CheR [Bacteroidota bacterium]
MEQLDTTSSVLDLILEELKKLDKENVMKRFRDSFIKRRIVLRIVEFGKDLDEYYLFFQRNKNKEFKKILELLLVSVTEFFRDKAVFEGISKYVVPQIIQNSNENLKIWSAGCATGEEAYTMALITYEHMKIRGIIPKQSIIIGSDINQEALRIARIAVYPKESLKNVPSMYLKYFIPIGNEFVQVSYEIRKLVEFKNEDIFKPSYPPQSFDVVLLRNVLIYYSRESQIEILKKVYRLLKGGGFLILGKTEAVPMELRDLYDYYKGDFGLRSRIYVKKEK